MSQSVKHVILSFGMKANSDFSPAASGPGPNGSFQYTFGKFGSTEFTIDKSGNADIIDGIVNNQPLTGQAAEFVMDGISQLIVDGNAAAIAVGDKLGSNATGQGIKVTADHAKYGAIAMQASTAAGDQIAVKVVPGRPTISV